MKKKKPTQPIDADVDYCPNPDCGVPVNWNAERCLRCKTDLGVPNQRELARQYEVEALQQRYQTAIDNADAKGSKLQLLEFEQQVKTAGKAVMNMSAKLLDDFLTGGNLLMSGYSLQVDAKIRQAAKQWDDTCRRGTEATLFGSYAKEIRYAALALNHHGLSSYGECSATLADITLQNSATVMEENSFTFVRKHRILPGDKAPAGHRSTWADKHLLAVAKIGDRITADTDQFVNLLLRNTGDRKTDKFIEVHIYGEFNCSSFTDITIPKLEKDPGLVKKLKDHAKAQNIRIESL